MGFCGPRSGSFSRRGFRGFFPNADSEVRAELLAHVAGDAALGSRHVRIAPLVGLENLFRAECHTDAAALTPSRIELNLGFRRALLGRLSFLCGHTRFTSVEEFRFRAVVEASHPARKPVDDARKGGQERHNDEHDCREGQSGQGDPSQTLVGQRLNNE